jgi:hypothetical protein
MAQAKERGVFMIHSGEDRLGRRYLDEFFTGAGVPAYWYPFPEGKSYPPAPRILRAIERSAGVFVVLSKGMEAKSHTRSWVAWEAGVAHGLKRPVWVFENVRDKIGVPIPSCEGYVQWGDVPNSLATFVVKNLVRSAGNVVPNMDPGSPVWFEAVCQNPECRSEFKALVLDEKTARCPACRQSTISRSTLSELQARVESSV